MKIPALLATAVLALALLAACAAVPAGACAAAEDPCLSDPDLTVVEGVAFADYDNDGRRARPDETRSADLPVFADRDRDGQHDPGDEELIWPDRTGAYRLELRGSTLPPAGERLAIGVAVRGSAVCTAPRSCMRELELQPGERVTGQDFGVGGPGAVHGQVYDDVDADGRREEGEGPLPGSKVFLDVDRDGAHDAGEPQDRAQPGTGRYLLVVPPEWIGKALPPVTVEATRGRACSQPGDCGGTGLTLVGREGTAQSRDLGVARPVLIFIHGYGGAEIACGGDRLWIGGADGRPDLEDMRFEADGSRPLTRASGGSACTETSGPTGQLIRTAFGDDIYGSAADHYAGLAEEGRSANFVWDFRRNPKSVVGDLDALVERMRCGGEPPCARRRVEQVQLVTHSQGGLVMRHYIEDPERARKVQRAVAIGTPFWGAPKSILPIIAGVESLDNKLPSPDMLFDNEDFKALARTLPGHFSLMPSYGYWRWLQVDGVRDGERLDPDGVQEYLGRLGVHPALYGQSVADRSQVLGRFRDHGVDLHLVVGEGMPAIGNVSVRHGIDPSVEIGFVSGDETVPAVSSAHDAPEDRVHRVCGVSHIPLTAHPQTTALIDDWLVSGRKIQDRPRDCRMEGIRVKLYHPSGLVELPPAARAARPRARAAQAPGGLTPAEAEKRGLVDVIDLGTRQTIVTDARRPVDLALVARPGTVVSVAPVTERGTGPERTYGPFTGPVQLTTGGGGAVTVRSGGRAARPVSVPRRAPVTRASVRRARGGRFTLALQAPKGTVTWVVRGGKRTRYRRPLTLTRRELAAVRFGSVDAFGTSERERRAPRPPRAPRGRS